MTASHTLPTIIVVHPREKRSKCSVEPLRGREGFVFWTFPERGDESLSSYVRLGFGGIPLSETDQDHGLLVLDGTWRLAQRMENLYGEISIRSLPECSTAYPRVSKFEADPLGGLATIEALFVAHRILGRPTVGLLDQYHWADEFLRANGWNSDAVGVNRPKGGESC